MDLRQDFLLTPRLGVKKNLCRQASGAGARGVETGGGRGGRKGKRGRRGDSGQECSAVMERRKDCVSLFPSSLEKPKTRVLFIPQVLTECLLCARPMLGSGDKAEAKT